MNVKRSKQRPPTSLLRREPTSLLLILGFLFVAAFCLRLYGIGEPPMDFVPVRQYHGALLARGFYEWLQAGAMRALPPDGVLEPPILELISSAGYVVLGKEHLWLPRALSALFWTGGGVFVYLTARRLFSGGAALISTSVYLFLPYGILAGRAFMPDPLMVMMLCSSVYAVLWYHEEPSTRRLLLASAASALAVFVKPGIAAFQIFGAFAAISIHQQGLRKSLASPRSFLFAVLTVLPTALYYLYGTYLAGFLEGEMQEKVIPGYLLDPYYWQGWLRCVRIVVGYMAFTLGLLGVLLCRSVSARALLFGLWGGYLAFGFIFTYHIHTHQYYSLQLIPVVALSLGALWDAAEVRYLRTPSWARAVLLVLCLLIVTVGLAEHRNTIRGTAYALRGDASKWRTSKPILPTDYDARAWTYRQIGKAVNHSSRTVFTAPDWGYPLIYHGRIDGEYWPDPGMWSWLELNGRAPNSDRRHYWAELRSEHSPEYFVVIKQAGPREPNWREDKLLGAIVEGYPMVANDDLYVVFDLRGDKTERHEVISQP